MSTPNDWRSSIKLAWLILLALGYLITVQPLVCSLQKTRSHGPNAKFRIRSSAKKNAKSGTSVISKTQTEAAPSNTVTNGDLLDQSLTNLNSSIPSTPTSADERKRKRETTFVNIRTKEESRPSIAVISGRKIPSSNKASKTVPEKQSVEQNTQEPTRTAASLEKGSVDKHKEGRKKVSTQPATQTTTDTKTCDKGPKTNLDPTQAGGYKIKDEAKIQLDEESEDDDDMTLEDVKSLLKDPNQPQTIQE